MSETIQHAALHDLENEALADLQRKVGVGEPEKIRFIFHSVTDDEIDRCVNELARIVEKRIRQSSPLRASLRRLGKKIRATISRIVPGART